MSISAVCACSAPIEAPDELAGRSVKCPKCAAPVSIPRPSPVAIQMARTGDYREDGDIPAALKEKALAALQANERVVWMGQPAAALVLRRSVGYFVVAVVLVLFTLIWFFGSLTPKQPPAPAGKGAAGKGAPAQQAAKAPAPARRFDPLTLIMLVGSIGCALVPFYRVRMAKRTCYTLTNRHALIYKEGLFSPTHESYPPVEVAKMRRSNSWIFSGGGDLIFKTIKVVSTSYRSGGGSSTSVRTIHYGFLAIPHVGEVEKLVRESLIDPFVDKLREAGAL